MNRKTFYAPDGTPFTIKWWTGIGLLVDRDKVYVINDGGLKLDSYYDNEAALFAAI